MWGAGKSLLAPIAGSFKNVEKQKLDYNFEHISTMGTYGKIDKSAAKVLLQIMADVDIFNSMISREINLRPSDLSGIFNNPRATTYLRRLFKVGQEDKAVREIINNKTILQIMTHNILPVSKPLFNTFKDELTLAVMVRHPVYKLEWWYNFIERVGVDQRVFTLATGDKGEIPWFANGIEDYDELSTIDKVIYSMKLLTERQNKLLSSLNNNERNRILFIPFESFVTTPYLFINKLTKLLNTECTVMTKKILKKQKCPRNKIHVGKNLHYFKRYGEKSKNNSLSEVDDFERRKDLCEKKGSTDALNVLREMSKKYENDNIFSKRMPWE